MNGGGEERDLIATMDDADSTSHAAFFLAEEGTTSSFEGLQRAIETHRLHYVATMQSKPPMPWFNLRSMSQADRKASDACIRSLGPAGEAMPVALPPGQLPTPPYSEAVPHPPKP